MGLKRDQILIGLTGSPGSGCTRVAELLSSRLLFDMYSLSDPIRRSVSRKHKGIGFRKRCQEYGNQKRADNPHYFAEKALCAAEIDANLLAKALEICEKSRRVLSVQQLAAQLLKEMKGFRGNPLLLNTIRGLSKRPICSPQGKDTQAVRRDLAEMIRDALQGPIVFDSIKNIHEVEYFRQFANFFLINVDAPFGVRWGRIGAVQYNGNQRAFREDDDRDKDEGKEYGQSVQKCVYTADILLSNREDFTPGSREEAAFFKKVEWYVTPVVSPGWRVPTRDEIFMNQAYNTSLRSRCLRRQVGAVIVKDEEYVVSSGHNHVPAKDSECRDRHGGCYRKKRKAELQGRLLYCPVCKARVSVSKMKCEKGHRITLDLDDIRQLDLCMASHAEESAILQTARLGTTALQGAMLFTTTFPCLLCAKIIAETGIDRVVYVESYPVQEAETLLRDVGIKVVKFEGVKGRSFYRLFERNSE